MSMVNYISFPGLGIEELEIKRIAFSAFGRNVMWYGIIITFGIIMGFMCAMLRAKDENIKTDDVLDYAIYTVIFAIIGARLYYVVMRFDTYVGKTIWQTLSNIVAIWSGGLAIYGGIIFGFLTVLIVSKIKKIKAAKALDMIAPGVMLGQAIGRWGNFMNAEAYGRETDLLWRMGIREFGSTETIYVHPTFIYESLWNIIGFTIIMLISKKKKFDGQLILMYITWYGFGRMFIEGLRTDSLMVGDFRISQIVGFLSFFIGLALMIAYFIADRSVRKSIAAKASASETPVAAETASVTENVQNEDPEPVSNANENENMSLNKAEENVEDENGKNN